MEHRGVSILALGTSLLLSLLAQEGRSVRAAPALQMVLFQWTTTPQAGTSQPVRHAGLTLRSE